MIRTRFNIHNKDVDGDYRPVRWPIKYPYWCVGESDAQKGEEDFYFILVAYLDNEKELYDLWPEAYNVHSEYVDEIMFSERFPKPDWYNDNN